MLFRKAQWGGVADGSITVAFRYQKRPSVRAGGTLTSAGGLLAIDTVETIELDDIDEVSARRAGYESSAAAIEDLGEGPAGRTLYRIGFHRAGDDPRVALREESILSDEDVASLVSRLDRLDRVAVDPWTAEVLRLVADNEGVVSSELAQRIGMDRPAFKLNMRKLKSSGLTESLSTGYRISPRGRALLREIEAR